MTPCSRGCRVPWISQRSTCDPASFAWVVKYRRLVRDYEVRVETSEALIYAAMTNRMVRRLRPVA